MRTIWLGALAVTLVATTTGFAQKSSWRGLQAKKAQQASTTWAVNHTVSSPAPATPPAQAAPAPAPTVPLPAAAPVAAPKPVGCCQADHCRGSFWGRLWAWLSYRPLPCSSCKSGCSECGGHCSPRLYLFFLDDCHECANRYAVDAAPACCKPGLWGKVFNTGHRMPASPTGHGCGGIR